ncbi:MAG: hypothetical protein NC093_03965 [Alistipes sp.]|nr:hypothetical protein [Alistipes sp.]
MAFLDMFDKLDDIIYEPVKAICAWATEPLKRFEDKRKKEDATQQADIESAKREQETELEVRKKTQLAQLEADKKRWDADIDHLIGMQEIERNERILNAIIEYRRSMIEDAKSIAYNLSHMEMSLVAEAHELVLRKTEEYKALQEKAMHQCDDQLEEIGRRFANNERIRIKREDMILAQTEDIINAAKSFIAELNEDIKRINKNNTDRVNKATEAADKTLERMGQALAIEQTPTTASTVTAK